MNSSMTGERRMALDGAVRDLGGLPTTDGGRTRFGRVLWPDDLQGLTEREGAARHPDD